MTPTEIKAMEEIQGTGGFRVMQSAIEAKLERLKDVMNIDRQGLVAEQTLGRQLAYEALKDFLSDIKLTSPFDKEARKTYE